MNQILKDFWEGCPGGLPPASARGKEGRQVIGTHWALRAARLWQPIERCQDSTNVAVRDELSRVELPWRALAAQVHLHAQG